MVFKRPLIAVSLSLVSSLALAGMADIGGETNCTVVFSLMDKEAFSSPCQYDGAIGASMTYAIEQINFTMPNGIVFGVDDSSTFNFDDNGSLQNVEGSTTLNGGDAEVVQLSAKTLQPFTQQDFNQRYEDNNRNFSDVLTCFKLLVEKDMAFCFPYDLLDGYK